MGKIIYDEVVRNEKDDHQPAWNILSVSKTSNIEVWWDIPVKLPNRIKHNRPNMIIWDKQRLQCKVIDFSVPLDNNVPIFIYSHKEEQCKIFKNLIHYPV